jgi:hypothetical protein
MFAFSDYVPFEKGPGPLLEQTRILFVPSLIETAWPADSGHFCPYFECISSLFLLSFLGEGGCLSFVPSLVKICQWFWRS